VLAKSTWHQEQYARVDTRLLHGALQEVDRPWEPRLEDAIENPRHLPLPSLHRVMPLGTCVKCGRTCLGELCDACSALVPNRAQFNAVPVRVETKPPSIRPRLPSEDVTPIQLPRDDTPPIETPIESESPALENDQSPASPVVPSAAMRRLPQVSAVRPSPPSGRITGLVSKSLSAPRIASPPPKNLIR